MSPFVTLFSIWTLPCLHKECYIPTVFPWKSSITKIKIIRLGKGRLASRCNQAFPAPCLPRLACWNCSVCEPAEPSWVFQFDNFLLIVSPDLIPVRSSQFCRNLQVIFHFFFTALLSNHRDASDWFSNTTPLPAHCPQARDKSCYWTHHLDVLTLCDMIYREEASITISLAPCIDKMLKIQNCQDGTVHSLWLKQLSAYNPRHQKKKKKKDTVPITMTQSISAKNRRPEAVFLIQKGGPTTTAPLPPTNIGNSLLPFSGWGQRQPLSWAKQLETAASRQELRN